MSRGDLQEMEQSKTAVNANAKPAEPMPKLTTGGIPTNVEDLGLGWWHPERGTSSQNIQTDQHPC